MVDVAAATRRHRAELAGGRRRGRADRGAVTVTLRFGALLPATTAGRTALLVCATLAVGERVGEAARAAPIWASSYADDLLCLPLVLALVLAAHRATGRPPGWRLPAWHGLAVTGFYALVFEVLLPRWRGGATADILDAAAYLAGFLVFQFLINRRGGPGSAPARPRGALLPADSRFPPDYLNPGVH